LVGVANKAKEDYVKFALEFGMSPSARSRVDADEPNGEKENDRYFA